MSFLRYIQGIKPKAYAENKLSNYDAQIRKKESRLKVGAVQPAVNVATPKSFADVEQLIKNLRVSQGVIVDLRDAPQGEGQRYLDYLSGATFALAGSVERIQNKMFLLTPKGVKILTEQREINECKRKWTKKS